jgi:gliding motility-associated-like protein
MKLRFTLTTLIILVVQSFAFAQIVVTPTNNGNTLINTIAGAGVTISNINVTCGATQAGTFTGGGGPGLGIASGIVLTTGSAAAAAGPNNTGSAGVCVGTTVFDPQLMSLDPQATRDPCIITFNIVPTCSTLTIQYAFGSEEYPEFVNSSFNDAFGFFVSGPNPLGGNYTNYNIARLPNNAIVSINNVNAITNNAYYINNTGGVLVQYDGMTVTLTASINVVPCQTYTMKLAIADAGDCVWDSGVFLQAGGLSCTAGAILTVSPTNSTICQGQSVTLTATGGTGHTWSPAVGLSSTTGTIVTATPATTTTYTVTANTVCGTSTAQATVNVNPAPTVTVNNPTICAGQSVTLTATPSSPGGTYLWSNGATTQSITVSPGSTTSYTVTYTLNGCPSSPATATVTVTPPTTPVINPAGPFCVNAASVNLTANVGGGTWSGPGITNATTGTFNPATAGVGSHTITYTTPPPCGGTATIVIVVNPLPTVTINPASSSICIGNSVSLTASGASTYTWSPATSLSATTGSTVTANPTSTITYTVTGTNANGCSNTATATVNVNPLPTVSVTPSNPTICVGQSTALTASGASTYTWSPATGLSTTTGANVTANPTLTTTYTVTGTSAAGCVNTATVTVNVNPIPNVTVTPSTSICAGQSVTLTAGGATTYTWSPATGLSSTTGATVTATPATTTTYTVTGTTSGCSNTATTTITITPNAAPTINPAGPFCINAAPFTLSASIAGGTWSGPGVNPTTGVFNPTTAGAGTHTITYTTPPPCGGTASINITVHPLPTVTVNPSNTSICQGQGINLIASGATTYSWSPATGLSSTTTATVTASPSVTTTYTVTGTSNGCSNTATAVVTVIPPNTPTITPAGPFCTDNGVVTLNASVAGGTWSGPGVNPSTGQFDPAVAGPGSHLISYTTPPPCGGTANTTIVVNAVPVVTVNPTALTICQGQSLNITSNGATTYSWSPATGLNTTTGNSVIATPNATTTYTVTGTSNGCSASANSVITVVPPTTPVISPAGPFCTNDNPLNLSVSVPGGTWSGNGITNASNGTFDPSVAGAGTHTITYTTTGVCGTSVTTSIVVNALPVITVTPAAPSICLGSSVGLSASGATSYTWSPAIGLSSTTGSNVTANPTATTTYTVTGTTNGCTSSQNVVVTVNPLPVITINPNNPTICNGQSVTLTASGADSYNWSPSTALSSTNTATVTSSPTSTITYTVIGTSTAGCTNTGTVTVNVNNNPTISLSPANPTICIGDNINLTASGATSYLWTPATGLSSTTGATVTANPTTTTAYTVTGTDANGCAASGNVTVIVNPLPVVTVTPNNPAICIGSSVSLTANGASSYSWSPATGLNQTSGATVTANPTSTTTYIVTGTDANGCSNTATAVVMVNPLPTITLGPVNPEICIGANITLTASGASTYNWVPSIGLNQTTGNSVVASPSATTQYTVVGTDANGCVNSQNITVTVNPLPVLSVTPATPAICIGATTTLNVTGATTYTWSPATGLSSTTGNTVNASPLNTTTYTVTGTDLNGCINTTQVTVTVNPLPNVTAIAAPATICQGAVSTLTASGADTYTWAPASSLSSTSGASVQAQPSSTTTYVVTGTDINGCVNTASLVLTVNPNPAINVTASPNVICIGNSSILTATGASTYTWTPSATLSSSTGATVTANPVVTTTYTVTGTTMGGCTSTSTVTVTVNPILSLTVVGGTEICYGSSVSLTAIASGGNGGPYFYNWSPATGLNVTNAATVIASPTVTTTYTVSVSDNCGTPMRTEEVTVVVHPLPLVSFSADTLSGCVPVAVNFENTSPSSFACAWNFGDGNYSNQCNPYHVYNNAGSFPVSLTITDAFGCVNTQGGMTINVYPHPVADFTMGPQPTTIALPLISFNGTVSSNDVVNWTWNINNLDTLIGSQVQYTFTDTGSFPVTLYVVNQYGCEDSITKEVVILGDFTIYIPNAFSPNGDGKNETWGPEGVGIGTNPGDYQLYIFDRWGELIFYSEQFIKKWNGIPIGASEVAQQDTYVYKIIVKDYLGQSHEYVGHFTLIK